jgi:hypothetical protein
VLVFLYGVGTVKKQGAKRKAGVSGYLLLPHQVAKYVMPLHVALELLPLGLFNKDHANSLAQVINLMSVDSATSSRAVYVAANACADVLAGMFERVQQGKAWNVTAEERTQRRGEPMTKAQLLAVGSTDGLCADGYWCVVCGRFLPADECGVIVHDNVPHPEDMTFDEEERPQ